MSVRVLFVETDAVLVSLLSKWLEKRGMEVVACVNTAEAALQACHTLKPHLALLALQALPTSALELLKQMRAQFPAMQVLVSSFWGLHEEIKEAQLWGAKAGFPRPPSPEAFQHALEACEGLLPQAA